MFKATDTPWAPWFVIRSDDKKRARLNAISHLLKQIPYHDVPREKVALPKRQKPEGYEEPNYPYKFVPELGWPSPDRGDRSTNGEFHVSAQGVICFWAPVRWRVRQSCDLPRPMPPRHARSALRQRMPCIYFTGLSPRRVS